MTFYVPSGLFLYSTTHQLLLLCYNATSYNIEMTFHVPSGLFLHATTHQLLLLCYNATSYNIEMTCYVPSRLFLHATTHQLCSDRSVSVQEYMLTVSLGEELRVLGTSRTFLESPLRVIVPL